VRIALGALTTLAALALGGCGGEAAQGGERAHETGIRSGALVATPGARPGIAPQVVMGSLKNPYTGNPQAIMTGRQLFDAYNCSGCHSAYAGGGMGPDLRDSVWIYGGSDVQIFSTISEGRPNGMPAWGGKVPEQQIWQIVAFIRTLGTRDEPRMPPKPSEGG
jgi:cytochrome c oxidase cbb3-type subunit 3